MIVAGRKKPSGRQWLTKVSLACVLVYYSILINWNIVHNTDEYLSQQRISKKVQLKSPHFHVRHYECAHVYVRVCKLTQCPLTEIFSLRKNKFSNYMKIWMDLTHNNACSQINDNYHRNFSKNSASLSDWFSKIISAIKRAKDNEIKKKKSRICISENKIPMRLFY